MSLRSRLAASWHAGASWGALVREFQAGWERTRPRRSNTREARGIRLLREWLSAEQLAQFDAQRYFDVIGCDSGKRYRIHYGVATNVHELDDHDHFLAGWCFLPESPLVAGDVMLAQKIALENDEYGALATANRFPTGFSRRGSL
jgi:hypothetical protein